SHAPILPRGFTEGSFVTLSGSASPVAGRCRRRVRLRLDGRAYAGQLAEGAGVGRWTGTPHQAQRPRVRRAAVLSVHTSPLDQPGTGDAGGMNVYIVEVSKRLAEAGIEIEIFTRATSSDRPPVVEMAPGVHVRHVIAGPFEGLAKEELPAQLCA